MTDSHIVWQVRQAVPAQPSQLLIGDCLYAIADSGVASCLDAKTGEVLWKKRVGGSFSASPIFAEGHIYCFSQEGVTTVFAVGPEYKVLAENSLEGELKASPAVSGRRSSSVPARIFTGSNSHRPEDSTRCSQSITN